MLMFLQQNYPSLCHSKFWQEIDLLLKVFKEFPKLINCAANKTAFYLKEALPLSYFLKSSAIHKLLLLADQ